MKRFISVLIVFVMILSMLSIAQAAGTRIVVDCSGAEVEMPAELSKVVVTSPAAVAFITAMGYADKLIGTHGSILNQSWVYVFYDGFNGMQLYGKKPNAEELISAGADLAIIKDAAYAEELRNQGIPAVCFKYNNKEELYQALNMLGEIFGDDAKAYAAAWEEKLDSTIAQIAEDLADLPESEKCNVYYVDATGAEATNESLFLTAGGGSFVEFWINSSGANLVTTPFEGIEQIDQETALTLDPDTIFICGWLEYKAKDVLMSDPLWQDVPAVKNDRVFLMPTSFVSYDRFAVELPLMLDYTANKLYPEYHKFEGVDTLREFYEQYYGILMVIFFPDLA